MEKNIVVMNFSHVYEEEKLFFKEKYIWIDCTSIKGTNGYCDKEAQVILKKKIQSLNIQGVHFIDSGNYHYLSKIWTDKINENFNLIVFDHHYDMLRPLFGEILSCGSWILDMLEENKNLKHIILIGINISEKENIPIKYRDRISCIYDYDLSKDNLNLQLDKLQELMPVYISIDKDVLSKDVIDTSWDQGNMTLDQLKELLRIILARKEVIAIDICGENQFITNTLVNRNDKVNEEILSVLF